MYFIWLFKWVGELLGSECLGGAEQTPKLRRVKPERVRGKSEAVAVTGMPRESELPLGHLEDRIKFWLNSRSASGEQASDRSPSRVRP